ncbi:hematopoietic prostaglandin D synthase-like [Diorhabda carinulata]|uniref:hematopoietic prostaglandin D synthase-like n=1 Tax=Diorhabda carinulata TaxID=1163345 RepID=UPI0025A22555|nr:hematopoietic prostaglandin D synthase-like [Diorhabda carinulata]XP_057670237.1 hematopoietic prostaglandin D synthase-like [Diorhabda carinulata]
MAPNYKLIYFDNTGKAEAIRMIFAYAGIPFQDERILRAEWDKFKSTTPLGQLPVLEIDGRKMTQSTPISRYLANLANLAGKTNEENYEIDAAAEILYDLLRGAYESSHLELNEERRNIMRIKFESMCSMALPHLETNAKKNGGYIAIKSVSWADFVFITAYENIRSLLNGKDIFASYPNLLKVKENVMKIPSIKNYIKKRPRISATRPWFVYDLRDEL